MVKVGPVWTPLEGKWAIKLPDGKVVPWVAQYKHLGWMEVVMSGTLGTQED